jgi:hypothetical protein
MHHTLVHPRFYTLLVSLLVFGCKDTARTYKFLDGLFALSVL